MALSALMMLKVCGKLRAGMRVASMGYPDIIAPLAEVEKALGAKWYSLKFREDSDVIARRHFVKERKIPDAHSFFSLLGADLVVYDVVRDRGCEILCDLNYPLAIEERYDMVLDIGTLEHCFNIAQAAFNMASLVKQGGTIFHENPFNWGNHGFYGLNPTWYADFYEANGFSLLDCRMINRRYHPVDGVPQKHRFIFTKEEANLFAMARRDVVQEMRYPVQSKYQYAIPAAGVEPGVRRAVNE